jgi:hypothetical protein
MLMLEGLGIRRQDHLSATFRRLARLYPPKRLRKRYLLPARALFGLAKFFVHVGLHTVAERCDSAGFFLLMIAGRVNG